MNLHKLCDTTIKMKADRTQRQNSIRYNQSSLMTFNIDDQSSHIYEYDVENDESVFKKRNNISENVQFSVTVNQDAEDLLRINVFIKSSSFK